MTGNELALAVEVRPLVQVSYTVGDFRTACEVLSSSIHRQKLESDDLEGLELFSEFEIYTLRRVLKNFGESNSYRVTNISSDRLYNHENIEFSRGYSIADFTKILEDFTYLHNDKVLTIGGLAAFLAEHHEMNNYEAVNLSKIIIKFIEGYKYSHR